MANWFADLISRWSGADVLGVEEPAAEPVWGGEQPAAASTFTATRWGGAAPPPGSQTAVAVEKTLRRREEREAEGLWRQRAARYGRADEPNLQTVSDDEYLGMNSRQQAAIDFNTELMNARSADLERPNPTSAQRREYDTQIRAMFGERAGDRFLPNTAALLSALEVDQLGASIEDYFSGLGAITAEEVAALGEEAGMGAGPGAFVTTERLAEVDAILEKSQALMADFKARPVTLANIPGEQFATQIAAHLDREGTSVLDEPGVEEVEETLLEKTFFDSIDRANRELR